MLRIALTIIALLLGAARATADPAGVAAAIEADPAFADLAMQCPADFAGTTMSYDRSLRIDSSDCDGIEGLCLAQCKLGQREACLSLAYDLQALKLPATINAAEMLFAESCRLGHASGCTNRSAGIMNVEGPKLDWTTATRNDCTFRSFSWSCARNDAWGCTMLGLHFLSGIGTVQDNDAAVALIRRACRDPSDPHGACEGGKAALLSHGVSFD